MVMNSPKNDWTPIEPPVSGVSEAPAIVEAITEDFNSAVERKALDQLAAIKMATDQTRMNEAVEKRVAELVAEHGLPPKQTDQEMVDTLVKSYLDRFHVDWLNAQAHAKARDMFFAKYPAAQTAEKKGVKEARKQ
jgi:hypothetical protein